MSYIGENEKFSFRDGFCEPISGADVTSSDISQLGKAAAQHFKRIAVAGEKEQLLRYMYAFCSGVSDCGKDVFICENTDLPSFRYGLPIIASDCGIYFSGSAPKLSFFCGNRFAANDDVLKKIMRSDVAATAESCGKITPVTSLRQLYVNSIRDSAEDCVFPISAGISCGSKIVRELWQEFFTGEDDSLIFQVSDDGQHVNAYSTELGFIPHDKLILAAALSLFASGDTIYLPDSFHYAAESLSSDSNIVIKRFDPQYGIPKEASSQRFLTDSLYMCVSLAKKRTDFIRALENLPKFASAKRDVILNMCPTEAFSKTVFEPDGRVYITRSGKNRITLIAQSHSSETAAELCSVWNEKLKKIGSCKNLFH